MDSSLFVTVGLIFLVTLAAGYVRSRFTDRCLRSFHGFNVTLQKTDGKLVWGSMDLSSGGMELTFPQREGDGPRLKTTYLLYAGEYKLIQAILRYADRLTEPERRRRDADIARSFHPGPLRRLLRRLRIFRDSATDSLRDVLALVVGRVQKMQDRFVAAEGADTLTKLGNSVLTEVSSAHDPLLERHIGHQVVIEVVEGDEIHEHVGIFKEYSAMFLHLLDVEYPFAWTLEIGPDESLQSGNVHVGREKETVKVTNQGARPVLILAVEGGDAERSVDALVEPGGVVSLSVGEPGRLRLRMQTVRDLDMIVPRSRSAVRHRAERAATAEEGESMWDFVFDLGTLVRRRTDDEEVEADLRRQLEQDPPPPAAAARLGALLLKKQNYSEAGRWLRAAYQAREALPDGGRRVRMQLRELARRLAQRAAEPPATPVTTSRREVFLPLSHPPGEAQVDFGEATIRISAVFRRIGRPTILPHAFNG